MEQIENSILRYNDALMKSIESIIADSTQDTDSKLQYIHKSLEQYTTAMKGIFLNNPTKPIEKNDPNRFEKIIEIEKFNPYHGKDGRFTTAGAATSFTYKPGQGKMYDNAIAREKERIAAIENKQKEKPKTVEEAQDYAVKNLGFEFADYGSLDVETANHINDTVAKIQQRFPELKGTVKGVEPITRGSALAHMAVYTNLPANGVPKQRLGIGKEYQKGLKHMEEINKRDVQSGFHPKGAEDISSNIWHEYGHAFANLKSGQKIAAKEPDNTYWRADTFHNDRKGHKLEHEWIAQAAKSKKMTQKAFKGSISRYATKNDGEAFAEAFSEFFVSPNPRPECIALMKVAGVI